MCLGWLEPNRISAWSGIEKFVAGIGLSDGDYVPGALALFSPKANVQSPRSCGDVFFDN